ncbi:antitoxin MazE-like protein [Sandaracinobacter neustonicus]|nr:antitoxin MazE-like protein [Sandaracinobacter neustonicus]
MPMTPSNRSSASSRRHAPPHRARLRAQGLRSVELWVPDIRSTRFAAARFATAARAQSSRAALSDNLQDDQAFVENLADWGE